MGMTLNDQQQVMTGSLSSGGFQVGNLAAFGISPAQVGARLIDGSGNLIADTQGLTAVNQRLGREQFGPSLTIGGGNPATGVTITNSSLSFTLSRQARVLAHVMVLATISNGTTGTLGTVLFALDGTADGSNGTTMQWLGKPAANPIYISVTGVYDNALAAGSHTISLQGSVSPTTDSFFIDQFDIVIYQYGG
jgi:hypothetical protein